MRQDPFGLHVSQPIFDPFNSEMQIVQPRRDAAIFLERCDQVAEGHTTYCIHGQTRCVLCGAWCWLGNKTLDLVQTGAAMPICMSCSDKIPGLSEENHIAHVNDHQRKDGPHE